MKSKKMTTKERIQMLERIGKHVIREDKKLLKELSKR